MVLLFRHNIFTKKGGSTSKDTMMMDGPDTGKCIFLMGFFIGHCAPADMGKMGEAQQKKRG